MVVKVLGTECAKCKTAQALVERVVNESGLDIKVIKIDDIMEIMKYNILSTPAIIVDEVIKIKGHVPSEKEVKDILGII